MAVSTIRLLLIAIIFLFFRCTIDDSCDTIVCLNDSTCNSGICDCSLGFEGNDCSIDSRDKFIGFYLLENSSCTNPDESFELVKDSTSNIAMTIIAQPINSPALFIDLILTTSQTFESGTNMSGTFTDGKININIFNCGSTYVKQ